MVTVPGFPRPLYPPDASDKGKTPSVNGPDVEAYKRVVWRLGRWPGPAAEFDRAYSNGFAHGRSGNVSESGIAGMQRQANIDSTGWIGAKTFNFMRSVRVPEGCPNGHGGEMAMDAYAQSLLVDAWEEFGGQEPAPSKGTIREAALARLVKEIGTAEAPPNSNRTKYGAWYGMDGNPWCAMFTTWGYVLGAEDVGEKSKSMLRGTRYAYVPYIVNDARAGRNGLSVVSSPSPGDLVCFDWYYDGTFDHVGVFEEWLPDSATYFYAIEGNTSTSDNSNGGQVMRRERATSGQSTVFVRAHES